MRAQRSSNPASPSNRGARAAQAVRERRIALRVVSAVAVFGVLAWAVSAGIGSAASLLGQSKPVANAAHVSQSPSVAPVSPSSASTGGSQTTQPAKNASHGSASTKHVATTPAATTPNHPTAAVTVAVVNTPSPKTVSTASNKSPPTPKSSTVTVASAKKSRGTITIETFGYSFAGPPKGCKYVADVRNIQAGNFSQNETGLMASVRKRVMAAPAAKVWLQTMETTWTPTLKKGDKVAIGCARGHHRSVTLAVLYGKYLKAHGWKVKFIHRDIKKTW